MSDAALIVAMAAITYASRAVFLLWLRPAPGGFGGRFLEVFPLALFVSLATLGLVAPGGQPDVTIALWAALGGVAGAIIAKRSLVAVLVLGGAAWWAAKLVV